MKKLYFLILFFNFQLVIMFSLMKFNLTYVWNFFNLKKDFFAFFEMGVGFDYYVMIFLVMVILVSSLVSIFSEVYMEWYNNFKFFYLMSLFLFSMIILISSSSPLILMFSWDILGISSLFLILFYPNKFSGFNSLLTMMFNRFGDCLMIIIFCMFLSKPQKFFFLFSELNSLTFLTILMMTCSLTKSAQFPLSSWLPAAMSAPTPISAMVHSSTLVTAGLVLNFKMQWFYVQNNISQFLIFLSVCSFLSGGMLACLEWDLKKIVAFSTMSQISMIMLFLSLDYCYLALTHMLFHAFFKTMLFVSCGLIFMNYFSNQSKFNFKSDKNQSMSFFFFLSVFLMSGLIFSSSFFSKDLLLENLTSMSSQFLIFVMAGMALTSFYCSKLSEILISFVKNWPLKMVMISKTKWIFLFSLILMTSTIPMKNFLVFNNLVVVSELDYVISMIILFLPLMFIWKYKFMILSEMCMETLFMKNFTFSIFNSTKNIMKTFMNDVFFLKPKNFLKNIKKKMFFTNFSVMILISIFM